MLAEEEAAESNGDGSADASPSWRPAHTDWTLTHELLAQVRDAVLRAHFKDPKDFPRPVTALQEARAEAEERRMRSGYDKILDVVARGQQRWKEGHRAVE